MIITECFLRRKVMALDKMITKADGGFHCWKDVKSVLLFYMYKDKKEVDGCISFLESLGINVTQLVFMNEHASLEDEEKILYLRKEDITSWGFPKKAFMEKFNLIQADTLIDLITDDYLPMLYLEMLCKTKFRIGLKKESFDPYDFEIYPYGKASISDLFRQIMSYMEKYGE